MGTALRSPALAFPATDARHDEVRTGLTSVTHRSDRILIVDDDDIIRGLVFRWLTDHGYACRSAANGEEALGLLRESEFSLLVSDIVMPGMSGLELLKVVREQFPDMAVIMASSLDDRATAIGALRNGAHGYVIKPFDENEIAINVANALERRRLALAQRSHKRQAEEQILEQADQWRDREVDTVLGLAAAAEYGDENARGHIRRIGLYAAKLAEALGWDDESVREIRVAAMMHDVGKTGVPNDILLKPGKLTPDEFEIVKEHSSIGGEILSSHGNPLLALARDIALSHHEKWNGQGYPRRRMGKATPAAARIVGIADVYDALVTPRVYKAAMPHHEATEVMARETGKHFDPRMLKCFLELLPEIRRIGAQIRS